MSEEELNIEELDELDITIPEVGSKVSATIVSIRRGKLGNIVDISRIRNETIRKRMEANADRDAIQFILNVNGLLIPKTVLLSLHPNSTLYKLIRKYGKLKVGTKVELIYTERGTYRWSV